MYPNAETGGERINSLDPATFRYEIPPANLRAEVAEGRNESKA
jgi:hypothetical protein